MNFALTSRPEELDIAKIEVQEDAEIHERPVLGWWLEVHSSIVDSKLGSVQVSIQIPYKHTKWENNFQKQ